MSQVMVGEHGREFGYKLEKQICSENGRDDEGNGSDEEKKNT